MASDLIEKFEIDQKRENVVLSLQKVWKGQLNFTFFMKLDFFIKFNFFDVLVDIKVIF